MTPQQYLRRYTRLAFDSPFDGSLVSAGLTNYGSGTTRHGSGENGSKIDAERDAFTRALRVAHHGNASTPCGQAFYFNQRPLANISPSEVFYGTSIVRAFLGKASPDEIIDVLRLAMAIGRIGTQRDAHGQPPARVTAADYVTAFITLDCNGFAGAYFGVDGNDKIQNFASPGRRRNNIGDIFVGDAVVTHCPAVPYEHVGVIDAFARNGDGTYRIAIAEWGWFGPEAKHYAVLPDARVIQGPEGQFGLGWKTMSQKHPQIESFRYLFSRPSSSFSLGWMEPR